MPWASSAALDASFEGAIDRATAPLPDALGGRADVAFVFLGEAHAARAREVPDRIAAALGAPVLLGCTAGGVVGGGREFEGVPAVSVLAGRTPGARWRPFHIPDGRMPDLDGAREPWIAAVGSPPDACGGILLVTDPFSVRCEAFVAGLDFAYPEVVKAGGLASGASRPGSQVLFVGDRAVGEGAVGVAIEGSLRLTAAVAQGCRPIGPSMRITGCEGTLLKEVDGSAAMRTLSVLWEGSDERQRALMRTSLLIGFETDPFDGSDDGPWLIRNIQGAHSESGGIFVGEPLRTGRRVRFHVRDRVTSAEDLTRTLHRAATSREPRPEAALLFSCLGRGMHLFGAPDHDSRAFRDRFGAVPLGGFFCSGEIGPVGSSTHLHGYTSSFGLLRPR
jgi:small ligand-binding sensory domain FIST